MEILTSWHTGESAELKIRGRLDGYWADHLEADLARMIREGTHRLWLDFSELDYLSSLGISVLLRLKKQVSSLAGALVIIHPSATVLEILEISKLAAVLVGKPLSQPGRLATAMVKMLPRRGRKQEQERFVLETFDYPDSELLRYRTIGDPSLLRTCCFQEADCRSVPLGPQAIALGLGALGRDYQACQGRFGELLAVAGIAAYLPTDGRGVADFLMLGETTAAHVWLNYAILCEGAFSCLTRFETRKGNSPLSLTELVEINMESTGADAIGLVLVAETAGLVGALLQRPPTKKAPGTDPFAFPDVRQWLSFTGEPAYRNSTTLVVGVALLGDPGPLTPLVRPLGRGQQPVGHFHAAPFSHRTLPIGEIELKATVDSLFEAQELQGVLHLLGDYRGPSSQGESTFVRGACWAAPLRMEEGGKIKAESRLADTSFHLPPVSFQERSPG